MAKILFQLGSVGLLAIACSRAGTLEGLVPGVVTEPLVVEQPKPVFTGKHYDSCAAYKGDVKKAAEVAKAAEAARASKTEGPVVQDDSAPVSAVPVAAPSTSVSNVETNVQVQGVDESDNFKSSAHHIFLTNWNGSIEVLSRDTLSKIGRLEFGTFVPTIYVSGDKLIALVNDNSEYDKKRFSVHVFKLEQGKLPMLLSKKTMDGSLSESRLVKNRLLVISDISVSNNASGDIEPKLDGAKIENGRDTIAEVPCDQIAQVKDESSNLTSDGYSLSKPYWMSPVLTRISSLSIDDLDDDPIHFGIPGRFSERSIFVSRNAVYLANNSGQSTSILKLSGLSSGNRFDSSTTAVAGVIKDRWAMYEYPDGAHFAVATTTGYLMSNTNPASNHLFVLEPSGDGVMNVVGRVDGFGLHEDIRAIRYVNNIAYVVTFKKTDPLFAIDLTVPTAPKLLGELKVPGFSTYLHPFPNNQLVGIGFDAADQGDYAYYQGIQVSLFNTENPLDLKRLDVKIHGERGSFSDVTSDAHAFFANPARAVFALPITEYVSSFCGTGETPRQPWEYAKYPGASGAAFYSIADNNLKLINRLSDMDLHVGPVTNSHAWWSSFTQSTDVSRIAEIDGRIVTVSGYAIRAYDAEAVYRGDKVTLVVQFKREQRPEQKAL